MSSLKTCVITSTGQLDAYIDVCFHFYRVYLDVYNGFLFSLLFFSTLIFSILHNPEDITLLDHVVFGVYAQIRQVQFELSAWIDDDRIACLHR